MQYANMNMWRVWRPGLLQIEWSLTCERVNFSTHRLQTDLSWLKIPLRVGDDLVQPSIVVKNLGVILDSNLSMIPHINNVCKLGFYHIRTLGKIRNYLTPHAAKTLVQAMVLSRLDYANSLFAGFPKEQILRLQRIQNAAARVRSKEVLSCFHPTQNHALAASQRAYWL